MEEDLASECLEAFKEFLKTTEELITFTGNHQFIPGFQISLHELRNPTADLKLLNSMEEYITVLQEENGVTERKATEIISFNIEELQPKKSEINIADFAGKFQMELLDEEEAIGQLVPSDQNNDSPNLESSHDQANESQQESSPSPQRSQSISFKKAFEIGFHCIVSPEEELKLEFTDEYKVNQVEENLKPKFTDEDQVNQIEENIEVKETNENDSQEESEIKVRLEIENEKNLTNVFKKLLTSDNSDAIFDRFENSYSESWDEVQAIEKLVAEYSKKQNLKTFEFVPCGFVFTNCDNLCEVGENMTMIDFNQNIFSSFKNLYSNEFRM